MHMEHDKIKELARRRAANPENDWSDVAVWIERSLALTKPGGVLSIILPDGKPFTVRKPSEGS